MIGKFKRRLTGLLTFFGFFSACPLFLAGCASSVAQRSGTFPQEHTGPISVDITAVPAGATTLTIFKDKQDCDNYSHFDARLFTQCMEKRGYAVAIYGPDHQRTTLEELYTPKSAPTVAAPTPPVVTVPQANSLNLPQRATQPTPLELSSAVTRLKDQLEQHQSEVLFVEHPRVKFGRGEVAINRHVRRDDRNYGLNPVDVSRKSECNDIDYHCYAKERTRNQSR